MEVKQDDVNRDLSPEQINEMEERRIDLLNKAGINEQDVLDQANKNLNTWNSYFNENIVRGKDDVNFCIRDQWTAVERSEFTRLFKPAMTFNRLYDSCKKVIGEQRKNKPDLIVRSLTGKATQQQIDLRADLVRTISYASQNDLVYQTAFKSALMLGYGAFQISLDYESPRSFLQMPKYELITDATRTAFDPIAVKPHKGDGNYCARFYVLTRDEFFATYPYVTNPVSYLDPYMLSDFQWTTNESITIADYFVKEWYPLIIYKLNDGRVVTKEGWEDAQRNYEEQKKLVAGTEAEEIIKTMRPEIISKRQTQDYSVMHYRMIRNQIIDFYEWPSRNLPIIFVDGDSYYIEGRQYTKSFIHEARDAQKCINYFGSEIAAEIKNRRREQWLATPENISGQEQQWRNPEVQAGALIARPDPKTGQMPIKSQPWDLSPAIMANFQRAVQDVREICGFSEAEQIQGRDISGKARRERKLEGSMSAYVFFDNLNQAIEQGGRVVNDLLPFIIGDNERPMVVKRKDGKTENITLNQEGKDGNVANTIGAGDFDVEIDTGPSFAVQKEIALEFLQQTIATNPQVLPLVADLWAKNLDVQFMPQIAERFKTLVPPQILAKEEGKQLPPQPPNPQQVMMQMEMQNRQQQLMERAEELKIRQSKHELEKAQIMLDAQEMRARSQRDVLKDSTDSRKADMDFTAKIAKILSDNQRKSE